MKSDKFHLRQLVDVSGPAYFDQRCDFRIPPAAAGGIKDFSG
jgi:hypothetical protein